jgi:hypothetical protein
MFKLEGIELVSWTANDASVERTYECNGEVCGTGNERRPCNVLVVFAVKSKSIDICGQNAPRRIERRAGDSHHSHQLVTPKSTLSLLQLCLNRKGTRDTADES